MKLNIEQFNPCREGRKYYKSKTSPEKAWRGCKRGDWMLWIAFNLKVDDRTLRRAAALCADTVRHLMEDERSIAAVDATLRYANGEITRDALKVYATAAREARNAVGRPSYTMSYTMSNAHNTAAYAASVAYSVAAVDASAFSFTAYAACYAAYYAADFADGVVSASRRRTADICREVLTEAVFEKVGKLPENTNAADTAAVQQGTEGTAGTTGTAVSGEKGKGGDRAAVLSKRIKDCGFSTRVRGAFLVDDVDTVGDLVTRFSEERELYRLRGLGEKSVREIMRFLKENGLELGMKIK
jgi:hypothetical protein